MFAAEFHKLPKKVNHIEISSGGGIVHCKAFMVLVWVGIELSWSELE